MTAAHISERIKNWIADTLETGGTFAVEHPADMEHGDYAVNVALIEAKKQGKNPRELAAEYIAELSKNLLPEIEKIEAAGPGFINIFLKQEFFSDTVKQVLERKDFFGSNELLGRKKFFIEHTQPNPFKEFHIGHLMNNVIGESIARVVRANGGETKVASYHSDVGLHVARTIWALLKEQKEEEINLEAVLSRMSVMSLGQSYAAGSRAFEDDPVAKEEIIALNKKIYEKSDEVVNQLYQKGRAISITYFESMYERLGSSFDYHFYESEAGIIGEKLVREHIGDVFEESEGAIIFKGETVGLHTRVFLSSEGLPMYEAKEIGLAQIKKDLYAYDQSVTVTANEQDAFFSVVEAAIGQVFPDIAGKLRHVSHGMMKLPTGKMSSRTGSVITANDFLADIILKVREKMSDRDMDEEVKTRVAEIIAIGALKYSILRQSLGRDIIFDFNTSLSFEGDSGPYLQYSYVRAESLLRKAEEAGIEMDATLPIVQSKTVSENWTTTTLEKMMARFDEVVIRAGEEYAPHFIATYLIELAGTFNGFYGTGKIVDAASADSPYRLALTAAFAQIMKNGLNLLGIKVPERM